MTLPIAVWVLATAALAIFAILQFARARSAERDAGAARRAILSDPDAVTELRLRVRELERARERAEESNEAKNEYLADVSHEIRTPLGGIIGMTQIALDSDLTPEQRACIGSAQESAQSLLRVISDILEFSKIEAKKLDLQAVHFDLHDRIGEAVKSFGVAAHRKGLDLALEIAPGVPRNVVGDDGRLRQVMVNLIGNALKFTSEGEIVVKVELESRSKQDVLIHLSVCDTGAGVPAGKEKAIFIAYEQADESIPRQYGGTGLGLSISSRLVQLMGGQIWVENNPSGRGSTFHFTMRLWLQRLARVEPRPILPASGAKQRILIVDDHAATREILKSMLEAWELEVNTAADEGEALRLMADSGRGFAAVLIDTSLRGSDGFQLAEAIRRNPQLPGSVVMMLPSPGDFEGATRCRQMELPAYVTKPVSAAELADAITRALHTPIPVMRSAPATELFRTAAPRHILIVEDEPVNRELATSFLKRWGHTVSIASSGEAALSALVATQFDAILMDVQMPGMSGLELTRRIREQEIASETHIPIIGISARVGREDRMASIEAGMDDYVAKPLSAPELFGAIERVAPLEASGEVFRADQEALLTAQEIVARVDGNVALACRIVTVFLDDTPPLIESLRDAVASRNGPEISGLAHRLKGAVANFPLDEAVALAARVEILGRRESYDAVDVTFEQLEDEIGDALVALQLALSQLQTGQFGT